MGRPPPQISFWEGPSPSPPKSPLMIIHNYNRVCARASCHCVLRLAINRLLIEIDCLYVCVRALCVGTSVCACKCVRVCVRSSTYLCARKCGCMSVRACVRARVSVHVRACSCVRVCACVFVRLYVLRWTAE